MLDVETTTAALLFRGTFRTPPRGPAFVDFAGLIEALDTALGTAWELGDERRIGALARRADVTQLFALRDEQIRSARESIERPNRPAKRHKPVSDLDVRKVEEDIVKPSRRALGGFPSAMPRLERIHMTSPVELLIVLPPAFVSGYGAVVAFIKIIDSIFTTPMRIKARIAELEAEKVRWERQRTEDELRLLRFAANEISHLPRLQALGLEIASEPRPDG
jgi:hypothetical protein